MDDYAHGSVRDTNQRCVRAECPAVEGDACSRRTAGAPGGRD